MLFAQEDSVARKNTETRITRELMKYYIMEGRTPAQWNRMAANRSIGYRSWRPRPDPTRHDTQKEHSRRALLRCRAGQFSCMGNLTLVCRTNLSG